MLSKSVNACLIEVGFLHSNLAHTGPNVEFSAEPGDTERSAFASEHAEDSQIMRRLVFLDIQLRI